MAAAARAARRVEQAVAAGDPLYGTVAHQTSGPELRFMIDSGFAPSTAGSWPIEVLRAAQRMVERGQDNPTVGCGADEVLPNADVRIGWDEYDYVGTVCVARLDRPAELAWLTAQLNSPCCGNAAADVVVDVPGGKTIAVRIGWDYGH